MARTKSNSNASAPSTSTIGFEATALRGSAKPQRAAILRSPQGNRWLTADSRSEAETAEGNRSNNMDAAEPSAANRVERDSLHEVQPARASAAAHGKQTAAGSPKGERGGANQYKAENVFWVPADARWSHLQASAKQPTIGKTVDDAMVAIEHDLEMSNAEARMWN